MVKELTGAARYNPQFLEKANPDVVEGERKKELTAAIARLDEALAALG